VSTIEGLLRAFERQVSIPWDELLAGPQKVWMAIYEKEQERRLRARLPQFAAIADEHGHPWRHLDLTDAFAVWMGAHEYRDAYFEHPGDLDDALSEFHAAVVARVVGALTADGVDETTLVAVTGIAALFGLTRVSQVVADAASHVRGRLLVFFPGQHEGTNYRLLDARDGWNYLAVPITG
jgi:hypothetical protein